MDAARTQDPMASTTYEPGSVMKVVTLSGALDAGRITPQTIINGPGYIDVTGSRIRDWDGAGKGNITMTRVLEESYNVGAIRAEQMEGRDSYFHYLQAFGFGQPSGIDVAGEANVRLRPLDQWKESEVATAAFGQGVAVNMVQMATALNAVVDDDYLKWILRRGARSADSLNRKRDRTVIDQYERTARCHQRPATAASTDSIDQR